MYEFQDLGFVDPNPPTEEEPEDPTVDMSVDSGESGASALLTAAATAFTVALLL